MKDTGYKGDIELPIGPYDHSRYNHVAQSLRLLRILGAVEEIAQIKIGDGDLHLVLRNGKSLSFVTGTLNWDSNLEKIAKSSKREIGRSVEEHQTIRFDVLEGFYGTSETTFEWGAG